MPEEILVRKYLKKKGDYVSLNVLDVAQTAKRLARYGHKNELGMIAALGMWELQQERNKSETLNNSWWRLHARFKTAQRWAAVNCLLFLALLGTVIVAVFK